MVMQKSEFTAGITLIRFAGVEGEITGATVEIYNSQTNNIKYLAIPFINI